MRKELAKWKGRAASQLHHLSLVDANQPNSHKGCSNGPKQRRRLMEEHGTPDIRQRQLRHGAVRELIFRVGGWQCWVLRRRASCACKLTMQEAVALVMSCTPRLKSSRAAKLVRATPMTAADRRGGSRLNLTGYAGRETPGRHQERCRVSWQEDASDQKGSDVPIDGCRQPGQRRMFYINSAKGH